MKIQKLHIYNIASIVDATIDFTAQPLSDSDVFLITGDTGAGKTTILDAICLALFNNTPRLKNGKAEKVKNGIDDLTLRDPRRLMRRNTGEAMVELFFEVNGTEYEAEWHVQRGERKKSTVSLNNITRSLKNLSTNETITGVGTKDTELQAKIEGVINLDFDQFCRTTMLAQNEFTKFLSSDENERAAILEKITKTTEFSVVGKKVYEITAQKEKEWKDAQKLANDTGLEPEEINEKKSQIQDLTDEADKKKKERDNADKKRDWLKRENELSKAEEEAEREYTKANKALEGDEYKENCRFVDQWNATIDQRQALVQMNEADATIKEQIEKLEDQRKKFVAVLNGLKYEQLGLEELTKELKDIDQYLTDNEAKAETFANVQTIIGHLDTIIAKSRKVKELHESIDKEQKRQNEELVPARDKAQKAFEAEKTTKDELVTRIEAKDKELQALNLTQLRHEQDIIKDLLRDIDTASSAVKAIASAEEAYEKEKQRLIGVEKDIDEKSVELKDKLVPKYEEAKSKKEAAESARDLLRNSIDKFAKQMRTHLSVGCECPVCRQKISTLPLEKELDEMYNEAEMRFKEASTAFTKAESAKNTAEATIKAEKKRYKEDQQKFDNDDSVAQARDRAATSCQKCGVDTLNDNALAKLEALKSQKQNTLNDVLEPKIAAATKIETDLKALRDEQTQQSEKYEGARKAFDNAKQAVDDSENTLKRYRDSLEENQNEENEARNNVKPLIASAQWQYDWTVDAEHFKGELTVAADKYKKKNDRKHKFEIEISPKQTSLSQVDAIAQDICLVLSEWNELTATDAIHQDNLFALASDVRQEIGSIHTVIEGASNNAKENKEILDAFIAAHPEYTLQRFSDLNATKSVTDLANELEQKRQLPGQKKVLWENSQTERKNHQEDKPELTEGDTYESCNLAYEAADKEMTCLNQQIGQIQKVLHDDAEKKSGVAALKQKADEARAVYEKWNRLCRLIGDKEGKTFRTIAQSYIFDNLLHSANAYLEKLEPRYTLKAIPGTLYSSLEDAYQGFASRDTGSLSGGESFLVSLALALALSDIGQGLAVDTLFIDEGFGSLSGRPLSNAINTLRSLHSKNGRHVGIISHIQEVRENIPVQIQVNTSANNSSSTIEVTQAIS